MIANRLPGGFKKGTTEFFTIEDISKELKCLYDGNLYHFNDAPDCRKQIIRKSMKSKPIAEKAMETMVGKDEGKKLEKFTMCRYGALNDESDIDENGALSEPEYVPCSDRGTCKLEGKGCCSIMVQQGLFLSKAETDVFIRVLLPDKLIADALFLSVGTVKKHMQNIRKKTGLKDRVEITYWATKKGII